MIGVAPAIVSHNTDIFGRDAPCFKARALVDGGSTSSDTHGQLAENGKPGPSFVENPRSRVDTLRQWGDLQCPMTEDTPRAVSELAVQMVHHYSFTWVPNGCIVRKRDTWRG